LKRHGFSVGALHGDLDQHTRTKTLDAFRANEIQLLVASDVAARGLDIPAVSHIFNFDVPFQADDYVPRIGRTGRAGRAGNALMISTPAEAKLVTAIEKLTGKTITRTEIDGLEAASADHADEKDNRRSKRGGSRKGRGEKREQKHDESRQSAPRQEDGSHQPAPRQEKAPRRERAKPEQRAKKEHAPEEVARPPVPIRAHETQAERERREDAPPKAQKPRSQGAAGLGDHVPAFLLKPVPEKIFKTPSKKPETV
jgi:superfamily II DNA/RNA helicase